MDDAQLLLKVLRTALFLGGGLMVIAALSADTLNFGREGIRQSPGAECAHGAYKYLRLGVPQWLVGDHRIGKRFQYVALTASDRDNLWYIADIFDFEEEQIWIDQR